jgi:hypothetical protein
MRVAMPLLRFKVLAVTLIAVFALASAADAAKTRKHKKVAADSTNSQATPQHWGTDKFPAGPLYYSGTYLGDDPDPNIRFQIWRDISGRFGGEQ